MNRKATHYFMQTESQPINFVKKIKIGNKFKAKGSVIKKVNAKKEFTGTVYRTHSEIDLFDLFHI